MSSQLPVLSGAPRGSILGPNFFVLFIIDIVSGVDNNKNILMYADYTKIWRQIQFFSDHLTLQNDIDYLYHWTLKNKMKFHHLNA